MATLTRYPSSNEINVTGWTNPANAYSDDGVYATAAPAQSSNVSSFYHGYNFADTLTANDTINSVTVYFEYKVSTTQSIASINVRVLDGTTQIGSQFTHTAEPTSDTIRSFTVPATVAQLRSPNFRIVVEAVRGASTKAVTFSLDYLYVLVDYTPAGATYTLTAAQGAFGVSGQDISLKASRKLAAGSGSFALIGIDANLTKSQLNHYTLSCQAGNFAVAGQAAALRANRAFPMAKGSFGVVGQSASLRASRKLQAAFGAFTLSGQGIAVKAARKLTALMGNFSLAGIQANLTKEAIVNHYTLLCETGRYSVSGQAGLLRATRKMVLDMGSFILSGLGANMFTSSNNVKRHSSIGAFGISGGLGQLRIQ